MMSGKSFSMQKHQTAIRALCAATSISLVVFATGCASIVHGGARTISVSSDPAGARASISKLSTGECVHIGTTPFTVSLSPRGGYFRGQSYLVRFELDGYKTDEVTIRSELSGWYFGNIIFGGLIGMIAVDPATGAMWNLSPKDISQSLSSDHASIIRNRNGFIVTMVSELNESERAALVRIN